MHCFCGSLNFFQRLVNWWLLNYIQCLFFLCGEMYLYLCIPIYLSIYLSYFLKPRWGPCPFLVPAQSLQSCLTLCDPMDCTLPNSSVPGILQARILEWVAVSFSRGSSRPRDWTQPSLLHSLPLRWILYHWAIWEAQRTNKYILNGVVETQSTINVPKERELKNWRRF